jgi:hypothetical protein
VPAAQSDAEKTDAEKADAVENPVAVPAAAQLPKPGDIPDKRRRPRLLDRITGLGKS